MAFEPPTNYNSTIMVNQNYEIVSPTVEELTAANPILTYNSNLAQTAAATATTKADAAASSATTAQQAAAQATEISDPEGWRTNTRAMIASLALTKSDSGTLYFSGGYASATPNLAFDTLSVLFKTDFDFSAPQTANVFFPFLIGGLSGGNYLAVQYGRDDQLYIQKVSPIGRFLRSDIAALVGDGLNALAFVFKKLADGKAQVSFFVNGVSVQNRTTATAEYPAIPNALYVNQWSSSIITAGTVGYSDFCVFNFDVSATDAPYTLSDYQAGKRLLPALCSTTATQRALVALENYTIARNVTTKLIKDASGNGNDATVSGNVAGDMDAGIAAFVDELKTQINQQA